MEGHAYYRLEDGVIGDLRYQQIGAAARQQRRLLPWSDRKSFFLGGGWHPQRTDWTSRVLPSAFPLLSPITDTRLREESPEEAE